MACRRWRPQAASDAPLPANDSTGDRTDNWIHEELGPNGRGEVVTALGLFAGFLKTEAKLTSTGATGTVLAISDHRVEVRFQPEGPGDGQGCRRGIMPEAEGVPVRCPKESEP